ncbi:two-component response regulator [hydrothermal vent metagenome]|uniref:Two-component response regulator n=1 Tax=hydrothermal vent metagenome TaxID=652676 RepID=A0A1W1EIL2_9ZZZZ
MKILLLEDDFILNETLSIFLEKAGYSVDSAFNIEEAETLSFENSYNLYLLDINLPTGSGLELLRSLRIAEDYTDVIFITALCDMDTMALGFELGAIDYIKKPFNPQELLIRIKAKFYKPILEYGDISLDKESKILKMRGKVVDLGHIQLSILEKLLTQFNKIVTKDEIFLDIDISDVALRVAITKLKQKLDINIKNIRGKGYILEEL